ncbi:MAG: hypothetical protein WBL63_04725 [Candidatus Acidiferrum sp.]
MLRKISVAFISFAFGVSLAAAGDKPASNAQLSAAEIVNKNVGARGGLQAWRAVQSMTMSGSMGVGGNQRATLAVAPPTSRKNTMGLPAPRPEKEVELPFVMELARSRKQRIELKFNGQTAIQVYDGANGWKLRPFLNRREVEPFTPEEIKIASTQADLDGPLVDYAAKGSKIELVGMEEVEGHKTYKIKVTTKDGNSLHVWIDAQTFLETKIEGQPRQLDGTYHPVEVYFRDYRQVSGLMVPFVLETKVLPVAKTATGLRDTPVPVERITMEKVEVNPKLDSSAFARPVA